MLIYSFHAYIRDSFGVTPIAFLNIRVKCWEY